MADRAFECRARVNICGYAPSKTASKRTHFFIKQELLNAEGEVVMTRGRAFRHVSQVIADATTGEHWVFFKSFSNRDLQIPVTRSALPEYRFRFSVDWTKMTLATVAVQGASSRTMALKWVDDPIPTEVRPCAAAAVVGPSIAAPVGCYR